jgi:YihY family inner membrane protein
MLPLLPERVAGVVIKPDRVRLERFIDAALVTGEGPLSPAEGVPRNEEIQIPLVLSAQDDPAGTQPADVRPEEPGLQPAPITTTISGIVERILSQTDARLATISLLIALFTASGGMAMTMAGLDRCYDVREDKRRPIWRARPMAMLLTVLVALMILSAIILIPVGDSILQFAARQGIGEYRIVGFLWLTAPLRYLLGLLLLFGVLALIYRLGPSVCTRLRLFSPGSIFCVSMWILTAVGFRIYLDYFGAAENYAKTYGAVAGVAVLMLLFYLNALFLLLGAEINAEIDFIKLGIRSGPRPVEQQVAPVPQAEMDEEDRELKREIEQHRDRKEEIPTAPRPTT